MRNHSDYLSGREDSNLRLPDPQAEDSSLSVRNSIEALPLETAGIRHEQEAIGSEIQDLEARAAYYKARRLERMSRSVPWRLCGHRDDPATSGAWMRDMRTWAEDEVQRTMTETEVLSTTADTEPAPPLGLVGQKFGKLTVIAQEPAMRGGSNCDCICECGGTRRVMASKLRKKQIRSCGCLQAKKAVTP